MSTYEIVGAALALTVLLSVPVWAAAFLDYTRGGEGVSLRTVAAFHLHHTRHRARVARHLVAFALGLLWRALTHDLSKYGPREAGRFAAVFRGKRGSSYNDEAYKRNLERLGPALRHHYDANPHHPEHYPDGLRGMDLADLVEMLCDWRAAVVDHADGDVRRSIRVNKDRFGYDELLEAILLNTVGVRHPLPYDLIVFDADGTLRRCLVPGQPCPNRPGEWELYPDVRPTLRAYHGTGTRFAIASNQAGVGLGYLSGADARRMLDDTFVCAFDREPEAWAVQMCADPDDLQFRKPAPGMIFALWEALQQQVGPDRTLVVGDMASDYQAAMRAGAHFMSAHRFFGRR